MLNLSLRMMAMLPLTILCVEVVSLCWESQRLGLVVGVSGLTRLEQGA
jgi:hypothetical protein